jgi:hypothetical protein
LERYRTIQGYTKEVEKKTLAQRVFKINTRYTTDGKENTEKAMT